MDSPIQPMRPYRPDKLKDPSKKFLYAFPRYDFRSRVLYRPGVDKNRRVLNAIARHAAALDDTLADGITIDLLHGETSVILSILPVTATRSNRTWDQEVHFTRQVLTAIGMTDAAIVPAPLFIAPILASANPWFGNWGEAEGCRSQAAMMTQAEFYHRQGWDTIILDHGARWSVNGWGLQAVTPEDIARLRAEDEL